MMCDTHPIEHAARLRAARCRAVDLAKDIVKLVATRLGLAVVSTGVMSPTVGFVVEISDEEMLFRREGIVWIRANKSVDYFANKHLKPGTVLSYDCGHGQGFNKDCYRIKFRIGEQA